MNEEKCKDCQHFKQHYGFDKRRLFQVNCGHCILFGVKRKLPGSKACENFTPGPADAEAFATKEYLSKELLQYVLSLPLLPEIEEYPVPPKGKREKE